MAQSVSRENYIIEGFLRDINLTRFCALSAAAVVAWDHILTLDAEIELLRERKWSLGKVLFFLSRYWALATVIFNAWALLTPSIDDHFCTHLFQWQAASGVVSVMISHVALQLRLYALYDLDGALLAVTVPCSVFTIAFAAVVHAWALGQSQVTSHNFPGIPSCFARNLPDTYWILWLPIIAFEASLLGLVVRRAVVDDYAEVDSRPQSPDPMEQLTEPGCRAHKKYVQSPWGRAKYVVEIVSRTRRIFYVLVRDSVLYFFVMFACYVTNLVVWITGDLTTLEYSIPFSVALACVLCSRMLLNVREQAEAQCSGGAPDEGLSPWYKLEEA